MAGVKVWFRSSQALLSMLLVQLFTTGMQLLSRVILVEGTFIFALNAYRHVVAALCVAPFALYFERGYTQKLSWLACFWIFISAMTGMTMAQGLFYYGLRDTSATYSINFLNLIPICTFLVSIICRMEKLGLQRWSGKAKCIGAILCLGGAITSTLYKGHEFYIGHGHRSQQSITVTKQTHMLRGTFFLIGCCFSYTAWFILQVKLHKVFPYRYLGTMVACVMAAIQSSIIGVCIDSNKASWRLQLNLELVTIVYSGALATAATFCLLSWAIAIKGPTYPSMFNPLALVFVAFSEAFILNEPLKVGTLLGMVLIIMGLYSFLWGKKKEAQHLHQPNAAGGEVTSMANEATAVQSIIATVPTGSIPKDSVLLETHNLKGYH